MKNLKLSLSIVAIVLIAMSIFSCSKDKNTSAKHIPKDAFAVLVVNGGDLIELADPEFIKENPEYEGAIKELKSESEKVAELVEKMLDDPDASGVLLSNNMYVFATIEDEKDITIGAILSIDKDKLEDNLDIIADEFNVPVSALMQKEDGIQYFAPEDGMVLGWNDDVFMFVANRNQEGEMFDKMKKYMNLDKSESILSDDDFKEFSKNCKTINLWVSSNIINQYKDDFKNEIEKFKKLTGIDLKNNYGHMHFSIEDRQLVYTAKLRYNESIQNIDKKKLLENAEDIADLFSAPISKGMNLFGGYNSGLDEDYGDYEMSDEEMEELLKKMSDEGFDDELTDEEWEELLKELEDTEE